MGKYYLAVDIGASSGRHILGHLENGKIKLEEIYCFENGMDHKDGKLLSKEMASSFLLFVTTHCVS